MRNNAVTTREQRGNNAVSLNKKEEERIKKKNKIKNKKVDEIEQQLQRKERAARFRPSSTLNGPEQLFNFTDEEFKRIWGDK
jgi:hypothetical protein